MNKLPPQNVEVEMALLSILIANSDALFEITLQEEDFYQEKNQIVFSAIKFLKEKQTVDVVTIRNYLKEKNLIEKIGGSIYISQLIGEYQSVTKIKEYEKIIKDSAIKRRLINLSRETEKKAYDNDIETDILIAEFHDGVNKLETSKKEKTDIQSIVTSLYDLQAEYAKKYETGKKYLGISCGISKIDDVIDGLRPGHVWVVGAWTSTGKTQFSLNIVNAVLEQKVPVSIISLEMSALDISQRLIGIRHNISSMAVIKGINDEFLSDKIEEGKNFLYQSRLLIHCSCFEIEKIKMQIRKDVFKHGTKVFVLDYVQNVLSYKSDKEYSVITKVATEIQAIARELGVTVLLISQISNESEKGNGAGAGFKGSGALEAVADLAIRLKRDKEKEPDDAEYVDVMINIAKNRHGFTGYCDDYLMCLKSGKFIIK